MSTPSTISSGDRPNRDWHVVIVALALIYFAFRGGYYAINIAPNVPPDEKAHFGVSEVFAKTLLLPRDSAESYRYGLITHTPPLYYYLMGRLANVNVFFDSDLTLLRLVNVAIGTLTVLFAYWWMRLFSASKLASGLFAVLITNIPMFTFLCGSVNYDNLTNLFAAMSVYYLTSFFVNRRPAQLLAFFIAVCLGSLTKVTFLPLAAILVAALLIREWRNFLKLPAGVASMFRESPGRNAAILIFTILLASANGFLYGSNLLRFGRVVPGVQQVLTHEQCMQNPIFARDYIGLMFREGRIGVEEAARLASEIDDEDAKRATIAILNEALRIRSQRNLPNQSRPSAEPIAPKPDGKAQFSVASGLDRPVPAAKTQSRISNSRPEHSILSYGKFWIVQMARTSFGILARLALFKPNWQLGCYGAIFALAASVFLVTRLVPAWRRNSDSGRAVDVYLMIGIVLAYTAVLIRFNYAAYKNIGLPELAVQGRYLFPVLTPMFGLLVSYLICYWPRQLQWLIAIAAAAWFIGGDFPFFLSGASPEWFSSPGG